jgi:GT2 family glycosyltransferase
VSRVLVSILVAGGADRAETCLQALLEDPASEIDVLLTDNGTDDATSRSLRGIAERHRGRVRLLRHDENLGFARGHVAAVESVEQDAYEHVLLLNDDAVMSTGTLRELVAAAESADADIVGPAIVYADSPERVWQGGGTVIELLCHLRNPWGGRPVRDLPSDPVACDFVTGCALLIRTRLIREIGFLDPAFFYSVEDWDLCTRARRAGARIVFVPSCVVQHEVAATAGGWHSRFAVRHNLWGRARYVRKHARRGTRWLSWAFLTFVILPSKVLRHRGGLGSRLAMLREGISSIVGGATSQS